MAKSKMSVRFIGAEKFIDNINKKSVEVQKAVGKIVQETASNIEIKAKKKAPVDTGFMRGNVYSEKIDDLNAVAGSKAPYSIYVDKGTRDEKHPAQPFFTPAVESERSQFKKKIKKVIE
jgi:HK97 gp10 family phage protein